MTSSTPAGTRILGSLRSADGTGVGQHRLGICTNLNLHPVTPTPETARPLLPAPSWWH